MRKTIKRTSRRIEVIKDFWQNEEGLYEMKVGQQFTEYMQHGVFYQEGFCNKEGVGLDLGYFEHKHGEKYSAWFAERFKELEPVPTRETEYFKMSENSLRTSLREIEAAMNETAVKRAQYRDVLEISDDIGLGSFVADREDDGLKDLAVVVYDCGVDGYDDLFMVKRVSDGHLSTRGREELKEVAPLEFCMAWCRDQVGFGTKERWEEYARLNEKKRKKAENAS